MLTPVAPPGRSVSVLSIGHLLFGMLVLPRMPLVVLLLLCLLLQSCVALRIFWLEVAFCVFLCGIIFAHICWLSFRTATFKKNVLENIWPFPVVILVRVLSPQIGFGVCVRSVPSNRKLFSCSASVFKPSWKKKPCLSVNEGYAAIKTGHVYHRVAVGKKQIIPLIP